MAKYIWKGIVDKEQNTFKAIQIDITDSTYILDNRVVIFDEQDPKNPFGSNIFDESDLKRVIRSGRSHLIYYAYSFFEVRNWLKSVRDDFIEEFEDTIEFLKNQKINISKEDTYFYDNFME